MIKLKQVKKSVVNLSVHSVYISASSAVVNSVWNSVRDLVWSRAWSSVWSSVGVLIRDEIDD